MISQRVQDIRVGPEETPKTLDEVPQMKIKPGGKDIRLLPMTQGVDEEESPEVAERERQAEVDKSIMARNTVPSVDIEKKMKGLKEY
jgi:hypothetical protein